MRDRQIIDADFTVVTPAREARAPSAWTWRDEVQCLTMAVVWAVGLTLGRYLLGLWMHH